MLTVLVSHNLLAVLVSDDWPTVPVPDNLGDWKRLITGASINDENLQECPQLVCFWGLVLLGILNVGEYWHPCME